MLNGRKWQEIANTRPCSDWSTVCLLVQNHYDFVLMGRWMGRAWKPSKKPPGLCRHDTSLKLWNFLARSWSQPVVTHEDGAQWL